MTEWIAFRAALQAGDGAQLVAANRRQIHKATTKLDWTSYKQGQRPDYSGVYH